MQPSRPNDRTASHLAFAQARVPAHVQIRVWMGERAKRNEDALQLLTGLRVKESRLRGTRDLSSARLPAKLRKVFSIQSGEDVVLCYVFSCF